MAEQRDVLIKVDIDRKGADSGLGSIKTKGEKATKSLKDTKKAADDTGKSMTSLAGDTKFMGVSVNSLSAGFSSMRAIVGKTIVSLKIFKTALISTGIGALIIAAGALIVFLTRMQSGMDIVSKAMAQLGAVVDVILDRFGQLGKVIIAFGDVVIKLFKGDFVGAMEAGKQAGEDLKAVFSGIGEEIKNDVKLAGDLRDALVQLEEQEIANIAVQAERRRDIAKLLLLVKDETKSGKERLAASLEAEGLERAILEENIRLQTERVRIAQLEFDRSESSREDERLFNQEKAKLFQLEEGSLKKLRAISLETLKFQRLVIKEALEFAELLAIAARDAELERQLNHEQALARPLQEFEMIQSINVEKVRINQEFLDEINDQVAEGAAKTEALAERVAANQIRIAQEKEAFLVGFAQQGLASQQKFAKVAARVNQGVAIKQIFISTRAAIQKANETVPFPFSLVVGAFYGALGIAQAAAVAGIQFAKGGIVPGRGRVSKTGDKVLVRANPGEVFLNDSQQARLGGADTFRRIGVPGFQGGGIVPPANFAPVNDLNNITTDFADAMKKIKVIATIEDINTGQERVKIVEDRAVI